MPRITYILDGEGKKYAIVYAYMHGSNATFRKQQVQRLEQALARIPLGTIIILAGDWNFVLDTDRDIANATMLHAL